MSNPDSKKSLPWDRFVRLNATADALKELVSPDSDLLDVGGYDGALALLGRE